MSAFFTVPSLLITTGTKLSFSSGSDPFKILSLYTIFSDTLQFSISSDSIKSAAS